MFWQHKRIISLLIFLIFAGKQKSKMLCSQPPLMTNTLLISTWLKLHTAVHLVETLKLSFPDFLIFWLLQCRGARLYPPTRNLNFRLKTNQNSNQSQKYLILSYFTNISVRFMTFCRVWAKYDKWKYTSCAKYESTRRECFWQHYCGAAIELRHNFFISLIIISFTQSLQYLWGRFCWKHPTQNAHYRIGYHWCN